MRRSGSLIWFLYASRLREATSGAQKDGGAAELDHCHGEFAAEVPQGSADFSGKSGGQLKKPTDRYSIQSNLLSLTVLLACYIATTCATRYDNEKSMGWTLMEN